MIGGNGGIPVAGNHQKLEIIAFLLAAIVVGQANALEPANGDIGITFVNVAPQAGITAKTIYGDERKNRYLLETTGCGAAFIDYDNDGWQDFS